METTAVELADQRGNVWTVVGAKGGVGKTTLATNLAAVIATRTPRTVLLIDLDTRFGDIAVLLDLKPRFSVADLARAFRSEISTDLLHQALIPHESGAHVLAAPAHPQHWSLVEPETIRQILHLARQSFDYIIPDTPGAFTDLVGVAIEEADQILLTTSLERTSAKNTHQLLELNNADGVLPPTCKLIINEVKPVAGLSSDDLAEMAKMPVSAHIPYNEEVLRANSVGLPVVSTRPRCPAAKALRRLAASLMPEADRAVFAADRDRRGPFGILRGAA